jgi:glutamate racemase
MDNRPVGVFDSGVGGLTVARALRDLLPNERILYAGDTARVPYGGLPPETLLEYSREIVQFLLNKNVKAVVLACGTSSSTAYEALCEEYPDLIIVDVIRPGVKAVKRLNASRIGFIATAATVKKGLFVQLVREQCPEITVNARACPLFAPLAERGLFSSPVTRWAAEMYLYDWRGKIDALVLGCTHYPLLADILGEVLSLKPEQLLSLSESTAAAVAAQLEICNAYRTTPEPPEHEYYISGNPEAFNPIASMIMGEKCHARQSLWI